MTTNKKIAVFGVKTVPYTGGIENVVENTTPYLSNYEVVVYVRKKYYTGEKLNNVKTVCLPHLSGKTTEAVSHTLLALIHALFIEKANIFFFHAVVLGIFTPIPRLFGKKVILQTHGLDFKREKWNNIGKKLIHLSTFLAIKIPHRTICVGKTDQKYFLQRYHKKLTIVRNGVSIPDYSYTEEFFIKYNLTPKNYFLFMARLVPEKGAHLVIDAYKKIITDKKYCKIKLVIAGDTNYFDEYYYNIKNAQNDKIIFTGFIKGNEKYSLLQHALCFVQPSTIEGMSTGILEAMAMGVPPLVSDIQENLDVVKDFGYTFRSCCVDDLYKKLVLVLENHYIYKNKEMMEFTRNNYTWEKTVNELEKELDKL